MMDATERERLAALAEHRDDMTDRNGQPCYLRFTGASDSHEWATGKGVQNEPVEACVHCGSYRYTNEGRRGAYMHAAAEAVPALLAALAEAEAEVERLHNRIAVVYGEGLGERAEVTAERDRYRRQVDAVRALHTRTNGYSNGDDFDCCAVCFDADEQPEAWPCPTVRALDGAES